MLRVMMLAERVEVWTSAPSPEEYRVTLTPVESPSLLQTIILFVSPQQLDEAGFVAGKISAVDFSPANGGSDGR